MTRKESEKDSERPHYYSQFWLDIAAGKRTIGGPKPEDGEVIETETAEPVPQRRLGRTSEQETLYNPSSPADEYPEVTVHSAADEEYNEGEEDLTQDNEEPNDSDYQEDLLLGDEGVPDMDLSEEEEENVNEEDEGEENESIDYEDEDTEWGGGRGRKKTKVTRPNKAPIKKSSGKPRRGF